MPIGIIESLDHEARGITRLEGKTIFVEGALPGEKVEYTSFRRKPNYEVAQADRILKASPDRVAPKCPHYGSCGGCSMQHLDSTAQVAAKQRVLESNLWHLGRLRAEQLYAPIHGPAWGYRFRARLAARSGARHCVLARGLAHRPRQAPPRCRAGACLRPCYLPEPGLPSGRRRFRSHRRPAACGLAPAAS